MPSAQACSASVPITSSASTPDTRSIGKPSACTICSIGSTCARRSSGIAARVALYSGYSSSRKVGPGGVDHEGGVLGVFLQRRAQHVDDAEQRAGGRAVRRGQRRQRVEGAIQVGGTVDQDEAGHERIRSCERASVRKTARGAADSGHAHQGPPTLESKGHVAPVRGARHGHSVQHPPDRARRHRPGAGARQPGRSDSPEGAAAADRRRRAHGHHPQHARWRPVRGIPPQRQGLHGAGGAEARRPLHADTTRTSDGRLDHSDISKNDVSPVYYTIYEWN